MSTARSWWIRIRVVVASAALCEAAPEGRTAALQQQRTTTTAGGGQGGDVAVPANGTDCSSDHRGPYGDELLLRGDCWYRAP